MGCKRILLVDSGSEILDLFQSPFEAIPGWKIQIAQCGSEAMDWAIHSPLDAIVIDLVPPDLDGLRLVQQMDSHPSTRCIPKILLTAEPTMLDPDTYGILGAVGAIAKPFYPSRLPEQLADLLGWTVPSVQAVSIEKRDK
jgi:CheY-like chemotaxis protein